MATLSSALNYAVSGLSVASAQSAAASRNIAFAQDANYSRRSAEIVSLSGGGASVSAFTRSADKLLLGKLLGASSLAAGQQATLESLARLSQTVGDPEAEGSAAALVSKLQVSLRSSEANPSSTLLASEIVQSAQGVAGALNAATDTVQDARLQADSQMSDAVGRIRTLLDQFKVANDAVIRGAGTAAELSDNLDERDRVLKQLSEEIGIRTITRPNNDLAIYTEGGVTLFEGVPRHIGFQATSTFTASTTGGAVSVDGVVIAGGPSPMPSTTGRLAALAAVRDSIAPTFQNQLDEIARGLIEMFSEVNQATPTAPPDVAGLFMNGTDQAIPPSGAISIGLAGRIRINPLADAAAGGDPFLVRDGGFGGASYVYNTLGVASFQDRLTYLQNGFDSMRAFQSEAQLGTEVNIKVFSANSAGWIESLRRSAEAAHETGLAQRTRSTEALLRVTGVNIDEEMAAILDLEKSYQASAKVIAAVDSMLASLLEVIR